MFEPYKRLLTIGITAFNEGKYIRETIESCVNQAGTILICDNASTDDTQKICEELAQKYSNIVYYRTEKDFGKDYGFNFVLKEAKTKYFMWCGPHDILSEGYSTHMIHMLENSNAVGCIPANRSITIDNQEIGIYDLWNTQDLLSDFATERVYSMIRNLHDLAGFYGIFRTEISQKYPIDPGMCSDHTFLCNMAKDGKILFSPRSIFNWRQTKLNFSHQQIVESWQSHTYTSNKVGQDYLLMKEGQLKALKACKTRNIFEFVRKINLIRKAKKKLQKRFV